MGSVAIVTDSTANLPAELLARYDILVVPVLVHIGQREYRDGIDITPSEVYRLMRDSANGRRPRTATPSVGAFFQAYTLAAQRADAIISIHVASQFSAVYQVACTARDLVTIPVHVVDSETAAMGCGFAVLEAARLAQEGAGVEQIMARAAEIARRAQVVAMLPRLDYLQRGGHVPGIAALAGSALRLCPILSIGRNKVHVVQLPRTERRAEQRMLELVERDAADRPAHVAVLHADALGAAEAFRERLCRRVSPVESFITEFTPVMGAHAGPGLLGVAYYVE